MPSLEQGRITPSQINHAEALVFQAKLFDRGKLSFGKQYTDLLANKLQEKWKGRENRLTRSNNTQALWGVDASIFGLHILYVDIHKPMVPASWDDPTKIIHNIQQAKEFDVSLPLDLREFGLIHYDKDVRTAVFRNCLLTPAENALVHGLGINYENREERNRWKGYDGLMATALLPRALQAVFGNELVEAYLNYI